jgi:predicted unusual protein kinase regulating ubiquinone biosynthesis (AarF/ABC1/UbiB family)
LLRPYLRTIYNQDFILLLQIAKIVDRNIFTKSVGSVGGIQQSWTQIFLDAQNILYREIDYVSEAQNSIRFSTNFGITKGGQPIPTSSSSISITSRDGESIPSAASWLRTPYIYESLCTEQVLVMEYVPSIKISNIDTLTKMNVTIADRVYLADSLGRSYLRQFCCNKFCTYARYFIYIYSLSLSQFRSLT